MFRTARSRRSKANSAIRRRGTVTGFAVVVGALAFLIGVGFLAAAFQVEELSQRRHLFALNAAVGGAVVYMALGGFMVVQAASALGGTASSPLRLRWPWLLLPAFPVAIWLGQVQVDAPGRLPWLFPFINLVIVSAPSLSIAAICATRYARANPLAWPVSWREWTSGLVYGAIGATTVAGILNTLAIGLLAAFVAHAGGGFRLGALAVPLGVGDRWSIFFEITTLSVIAPLDEEFWKGMLVAFFFFRRGGLARCFLWGVLAGAGFNVLETFVNSIGALSPANLADTTLNHRWWLFALARAGTGSIHALATGLAAIGFYGLFRRRWRYVVGYPAGALVHGTWNFLVYAVAGDQFISRAWPDSTALDVAGSVGLVLVAGASLVVLWVLSGALFDAGPAPIYRLLGMRPSAAPEPVPDAVMMDTTGG